MEETKITKRERKKLNREAKKNPNSFPLSKILVVLAVIGAGALVFWLVYRGGKAQVPEPTSEASLSEVSPEDHSKGPENAEVTLVEYADYQCPACAAYYPAVEQLADEYKENLKVVYRHFPLRSIHKHAQIAAQAAEAAADQGMFWEMSEILYTRQDDWVNTRDPRSLFKDYANELTLNVEQFEKYMNNEARAKVNSDFNESIAIGLDSTPTFFINGQKIENPSGYASFREIIDREVNKFKTPEATGEGELTPTL